MVNRLFSFFTLLGLFLSAVPAPTLATESARPVLSGVSVSVVPHTATFRWYTTLPSDSWVDMEIPPLGRFRLQPNGSYASIPVAGDSEGSFQNWPHPVTNQMIGRCDGGGNVQNHCVTVVTPFQNTVYPYRVKSCGPDTHGDVHCTRSAVFSFTSARDTQAPTVPTNFRVLSPRLESIWLIWNSATDDHLRSLPGYKLYRNGELVKNFPPGRYVPSDTAIISGTSHPYYGYLRDRDPAVSVEASNTRREWEYIDPNLTQSTTYHYYIKAYDEAGNESAPSSVIPATTLEGAPPPPTPAQTPPSKPSTITTSVGSPCCRIDLSWEASTDTVGANVGVTGYKVYRDGTLITTVTVTRYSDTTLAPLTTYSYYVRAVDGDGNLSDQSPTGRGTTPAAVTPPEAPPVPTTPPTAPATVSAMVFEDGALVTWRDSATNETSYAVYRREIGTVPWSLVTSTVASNSASYQDRAVVLTREFEYRVDACNAVGCTSSARAAPAIHVSGRLPAATAPTTTTAPTSEAMRTTVPQETVVTPPPVVTTVVPTPARIIENVTVGSRFDKERARESAPTINDDKALAAPAVPAPTSTVTAPVVVSCDSNSLIKGSSSTTVYYCGADGKRHVFLNDRVYFSWYTDFGSVRELPDASLSAVPLGTVITYRPGARMVKIESDPKVYAVGTGGTLRWVSSEAIAIALYGPTWNKLIDDIPVGMFTKFTMGSDITE